MGISIVPRKYFWFLIQYFDFKAGRNQIKVFEVKRMPNETVETISVYVKGTLENIHITKTCCICYWQHKYKF